MPLPSLRSVLTTRLHSQAAIPLGCIVGAGVGGALSLAFRGCGNVVTDALAGGWMGIGFTSWQRLQDPDRTLTELQEHELALVDYPAVRQELRDRGTSVNDLDALKALAEEIEDDVNRMTCQFDAYCGSRDVPPNPLMRGVIRHFYLTHYRKNTIMLLSKPRSTDCYLVAGPIEQRGTIIDALSQNRVPAGTVLRQLHCPYMRVDVANSALRDARAFSTEECEGEMRVHSMHASPGDTLETLEPSALVSVTNRRQTRRRIASGEARPPVPDLVASATVREKVFRSALLREKLAGLAPDSRTWRELNRIEEDLAANRPCGHPVRYQGVLYQADDIHWEGRQSPGRNASRLLHRKTPHGYELVDIVDYHRPRS